MSRDDSGGVAARNSTARFPLRFEPSLRDRIQRMARANHRTMNAEIIAQLQMVERLTLEVDRLHFIVDQIRGTKVSQEAQHG